MKKLFNVFICLMLTFAQASGRVQPANPNASEDCHKVLQYLADLPNRAKNRVLSGQNCGHGQGIRNVYPDLMEKLLNETGKTCALLGLDYGLVDHLDYETANAVLIEHWDAGGLVTISWHPDNPWTGGDSWDTNRADLTALIDPGSSVYATWLKDVDHVAAALLHLKAAGVVVLWRPFHEMNGNWFWWCMHSHPNDPQPYMNLWKWMFDRFSNHFGLEHLLWVYSTTSKRDLSWTRPVEYYYPGAEYVDLVGVDIYSNVISIIDYKVFQSFNKPIALTEFGPGDAQSGGGDYDNTRTINSIRSKYPELVYWLQWHDWQSKGIWVRKSIVYNQKAADLFADPWVITRKEVDWQSMSTVSESGICDNAVRPDFELLGTYPNPFNALTHLKIDVFKSAKVKVAVVDVKGRLIENICEAFLPAGAYHFSWNGADCATGIYFFRVQSGYYIRTAKAVLLK